MTERGPAIVLIGFMGVGKSSIGRALASRTGLPLFDTDRLVSQQLGLTIAEIFAQRGEEDFRVRESRALAAIAVQPAVVVTGGGIVLREENVAAMKRLGAVVYLTADEETLFERATRRATRPLLQTADPRATFAGLLRLRAPLYDKAADVAVDTTGLRHERVVTAVLEATAKVERHVG
jgi:shikimate kinase